MTELTEKWKKGKLEQGWYYVRYKNNIIDIDFAQSYCVGKFANMDVMKVFFEDDCDVEEVLAPVPTYDEYKAMQAELAEHRHYCCCAENEVMRLKLAEMEELLRECEAHLSLGEIGTSVTPLNILLTRINAALGDMLKNPENFNTPDENVKGDYR